ncbi:MAG: ABC transporter ATP-binding protein [Albidovulum sp.]|nr:ABC transporter ATP-binding protein [Albidovulum sp.]
MFRFFENLVDPYSPYAETDAPPRRLIPFLLDYSRPFFKVFIIAAIFSTLTALVEVGLIYYMGRVVDLLAEAETGNFWAQYGLELVFIVVFLLAFRPMVQILTLGILNNGILPNYGTLFRWRAHRQVLRRSVGWFENDFAGRIANRIMQTPPAAGDAIFQVFDAMTFAVAYVCGAILLLSDSDSSLALPLIAWLVLYGFLMRWTIARVGPASKASSDARSAITGRVVDSYTNIHSVKLHSYHDHEIQYAKESIEKARQVFAREMRIYTKMEVALTFLNGALIVGVGGWAIVLWSQGQTSVGAVAAAVALALRVNAMTGWLMWALTSFFRALGVVEEGLETIADPIDLVDQPKASDLIVTDGEIRFENLAHHYGKNIGGLSGVNLLIAPGEKVGLVGRSGAGKSTLVKLLLRFYDIEYGRIEIDRQDIARVTQDSLRKSIGMVAQESSLLHRSIRANILYGNGDATEEEMILASKRAQAHDFVLEARDADGRKGYDAHVGERGVKLSGGQRQRIALARVILENAPILLLDEATSALDSESEAAIQESLYRVMEGKTVIAIAHRLSTLASMDRIVVLDEGKIVEEGSHSVLLAKNGLYAKFWHRQAGGFLGIEAEAA